MIICCSVSVFVMIMILVDLRRRRLMKKAKPYDDVTTKKAQPYDDDIDGSLASTSEEEGKAV